MFSDQAKFTAIAVVNVFETSRAFGRYDACVVLNDGAGISYGINQFTHRAGSLAAVVERYLTSGGEAGRDVLGRVLPVLRRTGPVSVGRVAANADVKRALREAATTAEMRSAQHEVMIERYLAPALRVCELRGFSLPLSLAVVYDSINHGSWERISQLVTVDADERRWVTEYVRKRHMWLFNVPRLRATTYRTRFFLGLIGAGDWELKLPLTVCGVKVDRSVLAKLGIESKMLPAETQRSGAEVNGRAISMAIEEEFPAKPQRGKEKTEEMFPAETRRSGEVEEALSPVVSVMGQERASAMAKGQRAGVAGGTTIAPGGAERNPGSEATLNVRHRESERAISMAHEESPAKSQSREEDVPAETQRGGEEVEEGKDQTEISMADVTTTFDRADAAVNGFARRSDSVRSVWATVGGTLWQAAWAVFGFAAGLPRTVWIVVAVIAAALVLAYLYRQLELGKIRERTQQ